MTTTLMSGSRVARLWHAQKCGEALSAEQLHELKEGLQFVHDFFDASGVKQLLPSYREAIRIVECELRVQMV